MNWTVLILLSIVALIAAFRFYTSRGGPDVSQAELLDWIKQDSDICILDVRGGDEYNSGHIPGAINIGHREIAADPEKLRQYANKKIVVYCEMGVRARIAQKALLKAGLAGVYHLTGDMSAWRAAGLSIEHTSPKTGGG